MKLLVAVSTIVALLVAVPAAGAATAPDVQEGTYRGTVDIHIYPYTDSLVVGKRAHAPVSVLFFVAPDIVAQDMKIEDNGDFTGAGPNGSVVTGTIKSDGSATGASRPSRRSVGDPGVGSRA